MTSGLFPGKFCLRADFVRSLVKPSLLYNCSNSLHAQRQCNWQKFHEIFVFTHIIMYGGIVWCVISAFSFLNRIHSQDVHLLKAKSLKRDLKLGIAYANFVVEKSRYLNVSSLGAGSVQRAGECGQACVQTLPCFSFNLASSPDIDGTLWCELLPTDKYNSSAKLQVSEHFDHYSIRVRRTFL